MHNTFKFIFFNTVDEAERFIKLYGGDLCSDYWKDHFYRNYFGKIAKQPMVTLRTNNTVMNEICSSIGLKERRRNGKKCYVFE